MAGKPLLIFDVESVGLHGEGFAVGWVVVQRDEEREQGYASCPILRAAGNREERRWVTRNVLPRLPPPNCETTRQVRDVFWLVWERIREHGGEMMADCGWPVEANFLSACVIDEPMRAMRGPYPLREASEIRRQLGREVQGEHSDHHPTEDARQSWDSIR
jgi:hypothetical protein